ncbi:MAG: hypothetical protein MMC33_003314 [Icmadophila ericetorum]|nr:hypothetical protein [Icmadophila ericetorum]
MAWISINVYLPPLRRLLMPAVFLLAFITFYRSSLRESASIPSFIFHQPPPPQEGIHIPIKDPKIHSSPSTNASEGRLIPPSTFFYEYDEADESRANSTNAHPILDRYLEAFGKCEKEPNKYTNHIRLPYMIQNISQIPSGSTVLEKRVFWNPTIIALPYWSANHYLVVSRIVTEGYHQENVLCEANICYTGAGEVARKGEKLCAEDDILHVGAAGGMRCATTPITLSVPPTPAANCTGSFLGYIDIPGFHDPRTFWSGKGEPLMMVNTQSRYACFGLWLLDLRTVYAPLHTFLISSPNIPSFDPLQSYSTLTELTRNPPSTRSSIEKNWFLFFPPTGEAFIHYSIPDPRILTSGRTFAKLLGSGLTTTNLTDPFENPCMVLPHTPDAAVLSSSPGRFDDGEWHQATPSLRLVLCERPCLPTAQNTVFISLVHRKHQNYLFLPLRYERYFYVWASTPPFRSIGISKFPILLANETASGWSPEENWDDLASEDGSAEEKQKDNWAYFTYTVSIAWAWRGEDLGPGIEADGMGMGYLDDEVLLGVGIDDRGQGFARVRAAELVGCLMMCF